MQNLKPQNQTVNNFCTLFDSVYLSRGLTMYDSLRQHTSDFHLYFFAFDELCYDILVSLNLENATVISLKMLENDDLLEAKKTRSRAEYCWTCTSSTIEYVLTNFNVSSCTYVDADLFFYRSPHVLIEELNNGKSVLITEHRYSLLAHYYEEKRAGRFCVQFITFTNEKESTIILREWKNQCLDWCYNRYEDGKFGDQKYLDVWPDKYQNVKILSHLGGGVAPWNINKYKIEETGGNLFVTDKSSNQKFDLIFYHFHFVRFFEKGHIDIGWNYISKSVKMMIYHPYILKLAETEKMLSAYFPAYRTSFFHNNTDSLREKLKSAFKTLSGYNII